MNMTHDFELPARQHFAQLAWQNAYGAYLTALATEPNGPPDPSDEEIDAFAERVDQAREAMLKCPAPHIEAVNRKLEAIWLDARDAESWEQAIVIADLGRLASAARVLPSPAPCRPETPAAAVVRHLAAHKLNGRTSLYYEDGTAHAGELLSGIEAWTVMLEQCFDDEQIERNKGGDTNFGNLSAGIMRDAMRSLSYQAALADFFLG